MEQVANTAFRIPLARLPELDQAVVGLERYNFYRPYIETADIVEFARGNVVGWIIREKTGQWVNHTSMAFRYVLTGDEEYRISISEAVENGVQPHFLSAELRGYKGKAYLVKLLPQYAAHRNAIAHAMLSLEGVRYDYWSLIKNLLGPVRIDNKELFCSEAAQAALIKSGMLDAAFNQGRALVPGQFWMTGLYSSDLVRIY